MRAVLGVCLLVLAGAVCAAASDEGEVRHILLLNSYHAGYGWTDSVVAAVQEVLSHPARPVELHVEYMDTQRISSEEYLAYLRRIVELKYASMPLDAVIASDDDAFRFMLDCHEEIFAGTPVVFCGVNEFDRAMLAGHEEFTGCVETFDIVPTLEVALRLRPGAKRVAVIADATPAGRMIRRMVEAAEGEFPSVEFVYLKGEELSTGELLGRLGALPGDSVALIALWVSDRTGRRAPTRTTYPLMAAASPVPIYGLVDLALGEGIVGGKLDSAFAQGERAAEMALRIVMDGVRPSEIPVETESDNQYMFDHKQLARFGIGEAALPRGSVVINRPFSVYREYGAIIWRVIVAFGVLVGVIVVLMVNNARRRRAEEALRESEEDLAITLDSIGDAVISTDTGGRIVRVNPVAEALTGWAGREALGRPLADVFRTVDARTREQLESPVERALRGGDAVGLEPQALLIARDGTERLIADSGAPIRDRQGRVVGVVLVFRDVGEARAREEELRESEQRYRAVVETQTELIVRWKPDGTRTFVNDAYCRYYMRPAEELVGTSILTNIVEEDRTAVARAATDLTLKAPSRTMQNRAHKPDGTIAWHEWVDLGIFDEQGRLVEVQSVGRDVTDRRQAEQERDRLFNLSVDMLCIAGLDGYLRQVNPAWTRVLGWSRQELLDRPWAEFVHAEDRELTDETSRRLRAGETVISFEHRFRCKDGSHRWVSWSSFPLPEEGLVFCVARDITEQVNLGAQLRQAQKMEAVGQLAGGVAHDFNNLLAPILGYTDLLLMETERDEKDHEALAHVRAAAERARALTRQLLAFSRRQVLNMQMLDLGRVVAEFRNMLQRVIRENISVEITIEPGLGTIRADLSQIEQILMNLAVNAQDAMPEGGTLRIRVANTDVTRVGHRSYAGVEPGEYVVLTVSDTGVGMDATTRDRAFEPFFTTKPEGTGLGLATVYGIVAQHHGAVTVESEPGRGATFRVFFPRVSGPSARAAGVPQEQTAGGDEAIVVVEDNASVRTLACTVLARYGYDVIEAPGPQECIAMLADRKEPLHLLLTDVIMPGMNGRELYERLRAVRPDLRVLYMSGYADDVIAREGLARQGIAFVQKPFGVAALAAAVRSVLDGA